MYPGTHALTHPSKPAAVLAGTEEVLTYAALEERSARLANLLRSAGLTPGDHIAVLSDNRLPVFEVYWAAMRSGLYLTAVNSHLSAPEAAYIIEDCGAQALFVSAALATLADGVLEEMASPPTLRLAFGGFVPGYAGYEKALAAAPADVPGDQPRGADMLYSSGTTGRPKGIQPPLPARQVDEPGDSVTGLAQGFYGFDGDTVYLSPAPIYHAAPLRFCGAVQALGGSVVMMDRFDAERALAAIERHGVTHSQWVPTMFIRMLKLEPDRRARYDLSSLQVAIHAAAPCPVEVKRAMIEWWGPVLHEYYASTEANGITLITSDEWLAHPGSVGRAVLGDVRICGDSGEVLPDGAVGTVYFARDDAVFEYHNDPVKTAGSRHPDHPGWTTTGDIGYLDGDGYLYLTDRKAFMIISGGVNIYPQEIEDELALHPAVEDVAVFGVPDEEMGESVKAVVQPAPGVVAGPALAAELQAYLRARVAGYKVPRSIDFDASLPRTPTGKLVKGKVRARYLPAPA